MHLKTFCVHFVVILLPRFHNYIIIRQISNPSQYQSSKKRFPYFTFFFVLCNWNIKKILGELTSFFFHHLTLNHHHNFFSFLSKKLEKVSIKNSLSTFYHFFSFFLFLPTFFSFFSFFFLFFLAVNGFFLKLPNFIIKKHINK